MEAIIQNNEYASAVYKVEVDGNTYYIYIEASVGEKKFAKVPAAPTGAQKVAYSDTHGAYGDGKK